ncbi:heterokaryon incompatibility protein-domain-containing protein, partial [Diaporthe sp. PMI_573]
VAEALGIFRPPAATSLDQANLSFIEHQLASTEKSASCNHYRPRRLLDIGLVAQPEPKIIDGQQAVAGPGGLRYAALSYCWGSLAQSRNQLKLTKETQNTLHGSIPRRLMTPVMRDAITVCRILGLRYLWVDSICIRQDGDTTDWEEQSQEMSHIFGNSWLTICAPASKSCLEGFLDHTDRHSRGIEIGYIPQDTLQIQGSFSLRVLTLDGKPGFSNGERIARMTPLLLDLECSEWNKRGWVFQERLLSPRLLYFGARMIHFQHGDYVASEDGSCVDGDFFSLSNPLLGILHHSTNLLHQLETIQNQGPFITDFWYSLIPAFSRSNFTDRKDTFPAIAGVARRVHEFINQKYLAGLWEEDLCCGLLWTPCRRILDSISRRPQASLQQVLQTIEKSATLIGPSWSWASRRARSEFMITNKTNATSRIRLHLRAEFKTLESRVLIDGVNPYGRINGASITLLGSMIRLSPGSLASMQRVSCRYQLCELFPGLFALIQPDWDPVKISGATGIKKKMRAHFQLLLTASCCSDWSTSSNTGAAHRGPHEHLAEPESMKPEYRTSFYEDSHPGFDARVHCDLCSDHTLRRDIWGLLLYPAGAPDEFYRVGTFFSRAQHGGSAIFEGTEPRRIKLL